MAKAAKSVVQKAKTVVDKVVSKTKDVIPKQRTATRGPNIKDATFNKKVNSVNTIKTKPYQDHHFATNKSKKYTSQFEAITKNYKLDLNGKWNREMLPHQGRHPNAYHEYVLENMQKFDRIAQGDTEVFLKLYDQMKQVIINNPEMLYKKYWIGG